MRSTQFSILIVLVILSLFSLNLFAQSYTQFSLPDGAKARFGKGYISGNVAYSPDGTRLAVASSIGIWLYDTVTHQEVALLTGHKREASVLIAHIGKPTGTKKGCIRRYTPIC